MIIIITIIMMMTMMFVNVEIWNLAKSLLPLLWFSAVQRTALYCYALYRHAVVMGAFTLTMWQSTLHIEQSTLHTTLCMLDTEHWTLHCNGILQWPALCTARVSLMYLCLQNSHRPDQDIKCDDEQQFMILVYKNSHRQTILDSTAVPLFTNPNNTETSKLVETILRNTMLVSICVYIRRNYWLDGIMMSHHWWLWS